MAVLRSDGLGPVDFGTPAEKAIVELTDVLGAPDRVEPLRPGGECVEGAGWLECVRGRILDSGQLAVWDSYGLEVALVDTTRDVWPQEQTALQFGDWHATVAPGASRLVTEAGLYPGMTVGELRAAVPSVEFTYNEGLLDSFYVTFGAGDGYWGRLDWDPDTADIEWHDVAAMQTALNDQGADLEVDGVWGPASKAAWLAFLSDHGVQQPALAAEWPVWLTPDIGRTLGLPPDDITIATIEPRPALDPAITQLPLPILREDGLGRFDFGDPADEFVGKLITLLGDPGDDTSYTPDGPGPFQYLPQGFQAAYELRIVTWSLPDPVDGPKEFRLVLSDLPFRGDHWDPPTPGSLTLQAWFTDSSWFHLSTGIGVDSTVAELQRSNPEAEFGRWSVCEDPYLPASFGWDVLDGTTDWDWISDLQRALNDRGAQLAVDGEYGSRTRAAVAATQQALGLDDRDGDIGPDTITALGLTPPGDARIQSLVAGYRSC